MMRGIWLAAILGIVLGLGVVFTSNTGTTAAPQTKISPLVAGTEETHTLANLATSPNPTAPTFELALLGLLIGLLVAAPFFLVARRRVQ
jgi:ABC-type phosphate/phosphonate transport system permease subunit